jgi:hypothetical protein
MAQASAPQRAALQPAPGARPARTVPLELRYARTCYDHMAGELAVRVFDTLIARGWLTESGGSLETTDAGAHALTDWGIDLRGQRALRRRFACTCLDWSERRAHLGGALGAALLAHWYERGVLERAEKPRVLRLTPAGRRYFEALLS